MFRAIRIESAEVAWIGDVECCGAGADLVHRLQCQIYATFFCSMSPVKSPEAPERFRQALSAANAGGALHQESWTAQPGWYVAFGPPPAPRTAWLRFYWNVTPAGALAVTRHATVTLDRLNVPFRLKVLVEPSLRRRDAAVLYLPIERWEAARTIVDAVCRELNGSPDLDAQTPMFTKELRPGVSLAEDPAIGASIAGGAPARLSFGMHRSWLAARSLVESHRRGDRTEHEKLSALEREFSVEGLSLERPYLNPGSCDVYDF